MKGINFCSSQGNEYFYDDNSGLIFPRSQFRNGSAPYPGSIGINPLGDRQMPPSQVEPEAIQRHHLDEAYGFRHLILETSQQCNLRCKYCVYSDHYPFNRSYTNDTMSIDTARAAVDLFMENHANVKNRNPSAVPIIGFYGGEPLLGFDVIAETVNYFQNKYGDSFKNPLFTLTTNGVLLTDEVSDFLTKHDFSIIVSLDGNKENHDRNRVGPDGKGSFDKVFANLQRFRQNHSDYNRLAISVCYDYKTDMNELRKFFDEQKFFVANIAQIDPYNNTYYEQFTQKDRQCWCEMFNDFHEQYRDAAKNKRIEKGSFLFSYIGVSFAQFAFHPITKERRPGFLPYSSCCVPGEKMFVTSAGKIHMCERINPNFQIGTINKGLNYPRIAQIIQEYNAKICSQCKDCSVTRFCTHCFATTAVGTSFQLPEGDCKRTIETVKETLIRYVDIVEFRPELLDDITVEYYHDILEKVGYINV